MLLSGVARSPQTALLRRTHRRFSISREGLSARGAQNTTRAAVTENQQPQVRDMDPVLHQLISAIHSTHYKAVVYVTGGAVQSLSWLLSVPGASNTILEASVPYGRESLVDILGQEPKQYCSEATALQLAQAAHRRGAALSDFGTPIIGVAATCSLASVPPKKGEHRAYLAIHTGLKGDHTTSVSLAKGSRSREGEDHVVSMLLIRMLARACGLPMDPRLNVPLYLPPALPEVAVQHSAPVLLPPPVLPQSGTGRVQPPVSEEAVQSPLESEAHGERNSDEGGTNEKSKQADSAWMSHQPTPASQPDGVPTMAMPVLPKSPVLPTISGQQPAVLPAVTVLQDFAVQPGTPVLPPEPGPVPPSPTPPFSHQKPSHPPSGLPTIAADSAPTQYSASVQDDAAQPTLMAVQNSAAVQRGGMQFNGAMGAGGGETRNVTEMDGDNSAHGSTIIQTGGPGSTPGQYSALSSTTAVQYDVVSEMFTPGRDPLQLLAEGKVQCVEFAGGQVIVDAPRRHVVLLPGSFNPLHEGHIKLLKIAAESVGKGAVGQSAFELSIGNADKGMVPMEVVRQRVQQFTLLGRPLVVTRAPLFVDKARLFKGTSFVVGWDTAVRLVMTKYHAGSMSGMLVHYERLRANGCSFIVGGRKDSDTGQYKGLEDVQMPTELTDLFVGLPEAAFRVDLSSTELRAKLQQDYQQKKPKIEQTRYT